MRVTILAKLILTIALPLLVVFLIVLPVNLRFLRETATQDMQVRIGAIVQQVGMGMSQRFERLSEVASSTARTLEIVDFSDADAYAMVRANVLADRGVYGSCIAFEPGAAPGRPGLFAPYAHRAAGGEIATLDVTTAYDYTDDDWQWYSAPRASGRPLWTEPFFDKGAGNVYMTTFSAPFRDANGRFRGVATVDIALHELSASIESEISSPGIGFIVVSPEGAVIASGGLGAEEGENLIEAGEDIGNPEISAVVADMVRGNSDSRIVTGFPEPGANFIAYAPIASTRWALAVTIPEQDVLAPVYARLSARAAGMFTLLLIIVVGILGISIWLTRPIKRLSHAVRQLATGDLDARAEGVHSRDEIGDLARAFNHMTSQLREKIAQLAAEMAQREVIDADLRVARQIQSSLLPSELTDAPGRDHVAVQALNVPARQVAGDFFDYLWIAPGKLLIAIADVSGKGISAAMFMAVTRTLMRNLAELGVAPGELVQRLNDTLLSQNDAGMFVTLIAGYYDVNTGELRYCNAGHPTPLRVSRDGEVTRVGEITGTVVGAVEGAQFSEASLRLSPGDRLIFFTDGVPEARAPDGDFFTDAGFEQLLRQVGALPLPDLSKAVADCISEFQAGVLKDDVTLLILENRSR